LVMTEK